MLSLVLPTYNEAENLPGLLEQIGAALRDVEHELIVVDDDSPDGTWQVALGIAHGRTDVHVLRRVGRRGLSSAVIEGFLAAKGEVLAVMDADGQHDAGVLVALADAVQRHGGIAVGSRYVEGGSVGQWDERRYLLSRIATRMAQRLCRIKVRDPMSGFFAVDRATFEAVLPRLNPKGFKILLDILVHAEAGTPATEVPFTFGIRQHGDSKLSRRVQIEFLEYLYDVRFGRIFPLTFVKYCIVGAMGVCVHVAAYVALSRLLGHGMAPSIAGFSVAVVGATETAIIFNFLLNNQWTFSHARLRGVRMVRGFLTFNAACAFGALANYAVSVFLFRTGWGEYPSVIIGAFTGVVWNYTMNRLLTWRTSM